MTTSDEVLVYVATVFPTPPSIQVWAPVRISLDAVPDIMLTHPQQEVGMIRDRHTHTIKKNARFPAITGVVRRSDGLPFDLTGYLLFFTMTNRETGVQKFADVPGTILNAREGAFRWGWSAASYTDTAGIYDGEFKFRPPGNSPGAEYRLPTLGFITVVVSDSL